MIRHFSNFSPSLSPLQGSTYGEVAWTGEARRCILHGVLVVDSSRSVVDMKTERGLKKPSTILCPCLSSKWEQE